MSQTTTSLSEDGANTLWKNNSSTNNNKTKAHSNHPKEAK